MFYLCCITSNKGIISVRQWLPLKTIAVAIHIFVRYSNHNDGVIRRSKKILLKIISIRACSMVLSAFIRDKAPTDSFTILGCNLSRNS